MKEAKPTGNVLISGVFVTKRGHRKAFQLYIIFNKAIDTSAGLDKGTNIFHRNIKSLQPSILADSYNSIGIDKNCCFNKKIAKTPINQGTIKA